ncbi:MAG: phosphohydrolase [Gallionellales bacterium RIFOXYD12_FULL_53_10]|nr:MAG: phosphohydrolase [Gallionellales bacterium GWA2_54_124]OGT18987.1 MAG: phosphohydrolase [Gallionellales bacterium RIFOXYD12_FULL_53_10]
MFTAIPNNSRELHRYLITRFLVSGIAISVLVGALVYYLENWRVEKMAFEQAATSAKHFDLPEMRKLLAADIQMSQPELVKLLENSRFSGIRIFDPSGKSLMEAWGREATNLRSSVQAHQHDFPKPGKQHYNWLANEGEDFVQVLIPLLDSRRMTEMYFEGVYRLDVGTQYARKHQARNATLTSFVAVILILILLYPVLLGLTRCSESLSQSLLDSNLELLQSLGSAIAKRDADTDTHNYRVTLYSVRLAETMNLNRDSIESLIVGAFLHDVGKIGVPDQILLKPGRLTADEFEIMKRHVVFGGEIIQDSTWLKRARDVVLFHHEKFDGSGYPHGIYGKDIPLSARLFAVVDVFDALMSKRPYKESLLIDDALKILQDGAGGHFDPEVVGIFITVAATLYGEIGQSDRGYLQKTLKVIIKKYF